MSPAEIALYRSFFKADADYYISQLEKYQSGKRTSFNATVFANGLLWFLYRKLYKESLLIIGLILLYMILHFTIILHYFSQTTAVFIFLAFITLLWTTMGFVVNRLYIRKAVAIVQKARQETTDPPGIMRLVSQRGGVNLWAVILFLLMVVLAVSYSVYKIG
ncbi:MAG: DUF2628 domain-containing protein [Chitinophagaceae bacterium]|nr:DUF2628 domain-containing protein [Chitinophagaceae bacterium]